MKLRRKMILIITTIIIAVICSIFSLWIANKSTSIYFGLAFLFLSLGLAVGDLPVIAVELALVLLIFLPPELQAVIINIPLNLRAGQLDFHIIFFFLIGVLLTADKKEALSITEKPVIRGIILGLAFLFLEFGFELFQIRGNGLSNELFDNYFSPLLLFLVILIKIKDKGQILTIKKFFLIAVTLVAILGIYEHLNHALGIYTNAYSVETGWYQADTTQSFSGGFSHEITYRIATTLGHFLINATYFLVASLISIGVFLEKKRIIYLIPLPLYIYDLINTYSRAGLLILVSMSLIYLIINLKIDRKLGSRLASILIFIAVFALLSSKVDSVFVLKPITTSDGSFMTRIITLRLLMNGAVFPSLFGSGPYTADLLRSNGNLEIGWLISFVELGWINFILYMGSILTIVRSSLTKGSSKYVIPFIGIALMFTTFNSFGVRSTVNCLVWFVMALMAADYNSQAKKIRIRERSEVVRVPFHA